MSNSMLFEFISDVIHFLWSSAAFFVIAFVVLYFFLTALGQIWHPHPINLLIHLWCVKSLTSRSPNAMFLADFCFWSVVNFLFDIRIVGFIQGERPCTSIFQVSYFEVILNLRLSVRFWIILIISWLCTQILYGNSSHFKFPLFIRVKQGLTSTVKFSQGHPRSLITWTRTCTHKMHLFFKVD